MAYDINAALERLEKNLSEVESAKKQVEETIATSESLQQIIGRYSDSLVELNSEISKFILEVQNYQSLKTSELDLAISKIKTSCEGVVIKFNTDVKDSKDAFNAELSETLTKFGYENNKLTEQVTKLNSLHDALDIATSEVKEIEKKMDGIAKVLKDSQGEQDRSLDNIKSSLTSLPANITSQIDGVINTININAVDLNTKADEIEKSIVSAIQKLNTITSVLSETKTICNAIKSDIAQLKKSMDFGLSEVGRAINVNRWILVIGIIVLIILHFIK